MNTLIIVTTPAAKAYVFCSPKHRCTEDQFRLAFQRVIQNVQSEQKVNSLDEMIENISNEDCRKEGLIKMVPEGAYFVSGLTLNVHIEDLRELIT